MKRSGEIKLGYDKRVLTEDIPRLDKKVAERIRRAIETKLTNRPEIYGEPLRGELRPRWKLRVGDWRVIYTLSKNRIVIHAVGHRNDIYKTARRR